MKLFYTLSLVFFGALQTVQGYVECTKDTDCEKICTKIGLPQNQEFNGFECGETPLFKKKVCLAVNKVKGIGGSEAKIQHVCGGEGYDLTTCVKK